MRRAARCSSGVSWLVDRLLAPFVLMTALLPGLEMVWRGRPTPRLSEVEPDRHAATSARLSVVVAVRNEQAAVREAIGSLLRQDYSDLELIVVNDRSTDATGAVLADLASEHQGRLRVVTITELPPRWLGKPHALSVGAAQATGQWLLFTDADVVFERSCLRRAARYAERRALDHLTLGPAIRARSFWLAAFIAFFSYLLVISMRLYRVNDPQANIGVGLGAFNLIRRGAYDRIGGYGSVARRPDDDIRLGQRIRQFGLRQRLLDGSDLLEVEWYPSAQAAILGLEKNFFAGYDYNLLAAIASNALLLTAYVWPWLGVWFVSTRTRWLLIASIAAEIATFLRTRSHPRVVDIGYAAAMPISAILVSCAALRSVLVTLVHGGIRWRGTFYPLADLREP